MTEKMTHVDIVREALKTTPRWELRYTLDLSRRQINSAIRRLPSISTTETPKDNFDQISFAMGEQFPLIESYAQMGMTATETQEAIRIEKGVQLTFGQAREAVSKGRLRGKLRSLTKEEKMDSLRNSHKSRDEIRENVRLWLESAKVARKLGIETQEWTRLDWGRWIETYNDPSRIQETIALIKETEEKRKKGF